MLIDNQYASGYIHQAVYDDDSIVYARIAGKPVHVKAIIAGLYSHRPLVTLEDKKRVHFYGNEEGRCYFSRLGKQIGIATYHSKLLFSVNDESSYIIGKDMAFVHRVFRSLLRRRAVLLYEDWDMLKIFKELDLIDELTGHGFVGFGVRWDENKVNAHISDLVAKSILKFAA
jgi:hypothetical protein